MAKLTVCRTNIAMPTGAFLEAVRNFLFGSIDGATKEDKKAWRLLWKRLMAMEPGEFALLETVFPRSGPFHRRHMKIEQVVFDAQERFVNFDMFRDWLKIGAAWVVWVPGAKGGIVPLPKSISYAKAEEDQFRLFHSQVMGFLRSEHAAPYLWRHLEKKKSHEMMDTLLSDFDE